MEPVARHYHILAFVFRSQLHQTFMMDIDALNQLAGQADYLPTKRIIDMQINKMHKVTDLRQVKTKYGQKTVATLDNEFQIFLTKRVSAAFEKDEALFGRMKDTVTHGTLHLNCIEKEKKKQIELVIL